MSSRRPLQPIPAQSANIHSTRYARGSNTTTKTADGTLDMTEHLQDDVQDSGSAVSGLTSLEGDDEFERLMIQNARDERRLNEARNGRAQPFRKARTHPHVGLTMDNLERNDAQHSSGGRILTARAIKSPPSSSGSTRSDPPINLPAGWGRKARSNTDWMRNITRSEQSRQTPAVLEETPNARCAHESNAPRRSVEDSPLSHKSFQQGTPRRDSTGELDLTFDMNEASMLASTPYMPRSTKLDDIREREIESLREQGVATSRLDRIRANSPEEMRQPGSSTNKSANTSAAPFETQPHEQGSPIRRMRKRTNSWQSLSKSQPELGKENSPITVYRKSIETVGAVERDVVASAERQQPRPFSNRRTDSQDLLRRLARVSNTPSPKGVQSTRPQNESTSQPHASLQNAIADTPSINPVKEEKMTTNAPPFTEPASISQVQVKREERHDAPHDGTTPDVPSSAPVNSSAPAVGDVDATPIPVERSILNPKTPYVMGGWVDTPGPRTAHKPIESLVPRSQSQEESKPNTSNTVKTSAVSAEIDQSPAEQASDSQVDTLPRPQLPSSALQALVEEARASHDYGDDTIHSLEDLIAPFPEDEAEGDSLEGMPQAAAAYIREQRQHIRRSEINLRDINRGLRRAGSNLAHVEVDGTGEKLPLLVREEFSPWIWFRSFFWDERLKTQRIANNASLKIWGGVTLLGILLTLAFIWWASETVAWYVLSLPIFVLLSLE